MKQVIVIRRDLKMRRGKEIAQGSHASMAFLLSPNEESSEDTFKWIKGGQTKVCLQVNSEDELLQLYNKAKELGLRCHIITDAGRTEFNGVPTKTCLAIGPNDSAAVDVVSGDLKLY